MSCIFDIEAYNSRLKTRQLGRPCIYLDQVGTTIEVAAKEDHGTLVLAREQTKGRGQRTNIWQSPAGCAMGSLKLVCKKVSPVASRLCFLQHIFAVVAAKTLATIDDVKLSKKNIKLKWPNDIIYVDPIKNSCTKIGGILVGTVEKGEEYDITLSFGLNVLNREPTICIADIVSASKVISVDSLVADILNNFEPVTDDLSEDTFQQIKMEYTERCLQINKLIEDETHGLVRVREVNDDGFLVGEKIGDGKLCSITRILKESDRN